MANTGSGRVFWLPICLGLLLVGAIAGGAALVKSSVESYRQTTANPAVSFQLPATTGEAFYVGSGRCAACHPRETKKWLRSNHMRSVNLPGPDTIRADLEIDGTYTFEGRRYTLFERDGAYYMTQENPDGSARTDRVDYVTGFRRIQMLLTRRSDGRVQVLPMFREVDQPDHPDRAQRERGGRWFDYSEMVWRKKKKFITPQDPGHWTLQGRNWNERCTDCHVSRVRRQYDLPKNTYQTEWLELTIGCEACHGPGSHHVERWTNMEGIPTGRDFVDLKGLDGRRSVEACAECHAEKDQIWGTGFLPGGSFHDYYLPRLIDDAIRVYPDGRYKELNYNYMPLAQSPCYTKGGLTCIYCHDPHGSDYPVDLKYPRRDDRFCTDCHADLKDDIEAHTFHDARSEGSRCLSCHCMWLTIENGHGVILDHTISIPSPRNTLKYGIPNACTACHKKEGPAWALGWMRQWYGDRRYRIEETADVFHGGRTGAAEAVDDLVRMVEDPGENLIYRATAAKLLGKYPAPRVKEALLKGFGDREVLVRACSTFGLMGQSPEGVLPTMRRALDRDPSLAVRKTAAFYLINKGDKESMARARAEILGLVQTTPTITWVLSSVGHAYLVEGDYENAEVWYRKTLKVYPFEPASFQMLASLAVNRAAMRYNAKDYAGTLAAIAGLDGFPQVSPRAELWRGYALLGSSKTREAAAAFRRGMGAAPEDLDLFRALVSTLVTLGDHREVERAATGFLSLRPKDRDVRLWRAWSRLALGWKAEAAKDAKALLAANPKDKDAKAVLARAEGTGQ